MSYKSRLAWFQRHLNWTWALVYLLCLTVILVIALAVPDSTASAYIYLVVVAIYLLLTAWVVVDQKRRSIRWVFLVFSPLFLTNKKNKGVDSATSQTGDSQTKS
jgi:multisubunit Na+/H+ antiporter MnhB subunit